MYRERLRRFHEANPAYRGRERQRNRAQHLARGKVADALRYGRLTRKPCEVCGAPRATAHHVDYSKPLDVRWLCRPHHDEADHQMRSRNEPAIAL